MVKLHEFLRTPEWIDHRHAHLGDWLRKNDCPELGDLCLIATTWNEDYTGLTEPELWQGIYLGSWIVRVNDEKQLYAVHQFYTCDDPCIRQIAGTQEAYSKIRVYSRFEDAVG